MYQYGYDEHDLRRQVGAFIEAHNYGDAKRALEYAWDKHKDATRINGQPFIVHPLFVAKYSIALGANSEEQICIALLHDVCEDCGINPKDLPFNENVQHAVERLTFVYDYAEGDSEDVKQLKKLVVKGETFARLIECPDALLCKCIDRYHNLTTCEELAERNVIRNVLETHRFLLPVVYNALAIRAYESYHDWLYVMSVNLRSLNDLLAMNHNIALNTMS